MKLTDYYRMAKLPGAKSKLRFDCICSTGEYEPFEQRANRTREKRFKFYLGGLPDTFSIDAQRKADITITDGTNISSVYTPDLDNPLLGYGDTSGTSDALLFVFNPEFTEIEVFVARGYKNSQKQIFYVFVDGELNDEMEALRNRAKPTNFNLQNRAK